ncbi:MAG TPA: hypothetical protein VE467_11910 [Chryseolinea sp.]|nr:hypothetical protein [Chryseolinea sp.]
MKKVYRKRIVTSLLVLLPLIVVAAVVLYMKLRGFKEALEELVESESNGQYSLVIGKSSVDISDLSFTFNNLMIERNDALFQNGIRVVNIPYLQIQFGSVASMLTLKRFDIEQFVMEEPTIEIDAPPKRNPSNDDIILAQQIVQLYPAIQSLLGRFDIKSLTINRASVGMNKAGTSLIKLNLVDLLVKQWDIRRLTSSSQLLLKVGGQDLDFGKANLTFSGIEFNFQKHHLIFSDFSFSSVDTISNSDIRVSGKSLVLQKLDYQDLYQNKRYSIKRAEIVNPIVTAHFKLKKRTTNVDSKSVITRLVRHTLGECSVDSAVIRDARVHIVLQQDGDSVKVQLSRVNFKLHAFKVLADSNSFQIGGIEVGLNRTAIGLKKDMSLQCDRIFFDSQRNLALTKVIFFDSAKRETIAECEKLNLRDFDLVDFIFYKHVVASEVSLENGFLQAHGLATHLSGRKKRLQGIRDIIVQKISLKNVGLRYSDASKNISADNLSVLLNRVRRDNSGEFSFNIESVHLRRGSLNSFAEKIHSQIRNLTFNGKDVRIKEVTIRADSLDLQLNDFTAEKDGAGPIQKYYRHWKSASVKSLRITGRVPSVKNNQMRRKMNEDIRFGRIMVNTLAASLFNKETSLALTGSNIQVNDVLSSHDGWKHGNITGHFSNVVVQTPSSGAKAGKVDLNFPTIIHATEVEIENKDVKIDLPSVSFKSILQKKNHWAVNVVKTKKIFITQSGQRIFSADSVLVAGSEFTRKSQPMIASVEIFEPEIFLFDGANETVAQKERAALPMPKHLVLHPGIIHLSDKKRVSFGKLQGDIKAGTLKCAFLRFETQRMHVRINGVSIQRRNLAMDALHLAPNEAWFKANNLEGDLIKADLYGIHIKSFYKGDFNKFNLSKNLTVSLENFEVDVKRDKRQEDPPVIEKPPTLDGLLQLPEGLELKSVDIKRGKLRYTETSEKTAADGVVTLEDVFARLEFDTTRSPSPVQNMKVQAKLYNAGLLDLHYATIDSSSFNLALQLKNFDLTNLNHIVVPLQSLQIKSGYLNHYNLDVIADKEKAVGTAVITYKNLHLEIFKPTEPEKRTLGTELLTLLADGIILKHSKKNAVAPVEQSRLKHKSVFNYWVKSAVHGAMGAIRKGKSKKNSQNALR